MLINIGNIGATAQALQLQNRWLEQIQGSLDRFRELDSVTRAMGQHSILNNYWGTHWDSINNCAAIADHFKSHNALMVSISNPYVSNVANIYKSAIGLFQSNVHDQLNSLDRLSLAARPIVSSFIGPSTLTHIQESLAAFKKTTVIENTLKSFNNFYKVSDTYQSLISKHHEVIDLINPRLMTWVNQSFLELKNLQALNENFKIQSDGSVTGFGSSLSIDDIHEIIGAKINDIGSFAEGKSIEQKVYECLESFGNRHPFIRFIMLTILLQMLIGIYINNWTDSSGKIIKHIDQQQILVLKEMKREIKKLNLSSQALSNYRVVSTRQLTVRSSNSRDSKTIGTLYFGEVVQIINKKRHWTLVEYSRDNEDACIRGWVYTRYLGPLK